MAQGFPEMIYKFLLAVQFLTIIPVRLKRPPSPQDKADSAIFFPVAGLIIGIILYAGYIILHKIFPQFLADILILIFWVFVTRGMHLDGVADVFDGFYEGNGREKVLQIMKDPHIGAIGALGLLLFVLLKFGGIHSMPGNIKPGFLLVVPSIARGTMVVLAYLLPYARIDGTGRDFVNGIKIKQAIAAILISVISISILGMRAAGVMTINVLVVFMLYLYFKKRINGITGDCLGFTCEVSEISSMLVLCAGG